MPAVGLLRAIGASYSRSACCGQLSPAGEDRCRTLYLAHGGLFTRDSGLTASAGVPGARGRANQRRA